MKRSFSLLSMFLLPLATATPLVAAEVVQRLQRATGLWEVTSEPSPFSWEVCVDQTKDRLIDDDLWSNFEASCTVESQNRDGDQYTFRASCQDMKFSATFKGNLSQAYTWASETSFIDFRGETRVSRIFLTGTYKGMCPPGMASGTKKPKGGTNVMIPYENR